MKPQKQKYKDHHMELRKREGKLELFIDNLPVRYGQLPDGLYFLYGYAYDWTDNLMDLAQKYIDYRHRVDETRNKPNSKTK